MSFIPALEDPLPAYRFLVSLDPTDAYLPFAQSALITLIAAGQFSEVTGLGADLEVLPSRRAAATTTCTSCRSATATRRSCSAAAWSATPGCSSGTRPGSPSPSAPAATARSSCSRPSGLPALGWIFRGGLAAGWKGPQLKAATAPIAVESIEIAHEGLLQVPHHPAEGRLMITIDNLQILFDADHQRDEVVFALLFERHMARHERDRRHAHDDAAQAADDRSLEPRGSW